MISPVSGLALEHSATTVEELAEAYGYWVGIRSNHVMTQSGSFVGTDRSSRSISTPQDRDLLLALRAMADVIVVDAATARQEKYQAPRSGAMLAIFSKSGNFDGIPAVSNAPDKTLLFAAKSSALHQVKNVGAKLTVSARPLEAFVEESEALGLDTILFEAGPTLTSLAHELNLISQSALTVTPGLEDMLNQALEHPFDPAARLTSRAETEDASFTYWLH